MTTKKTRRNLRRRNQRRNIRSVILLILCIIAIVSAIRTTCAQKRHDSELTSISGNADVVALTKVTTTDTDDAQMINYPGFDVYFSPHHHQPYYCAWVLEGEVLKNVITGRTDNFRPDESVIGCATLADYRGSGFDRGHIVPAGDMKHSLESMNASFYLTNMSPQRHSLNSGAWKKLEELTRKWAERDSLLVVVAGPVLADYTTQTIGASKITVPERYFKVILAPFANPPRAIGFVMPNGTVEGGTQAAAMTVDQVEAITGYDFFSSLPDEVENDIESKARFVDWNKYK